MLFRSGGLAFWGALDETEPVLALASDVPPGAALEPGDLAIIRLKVPPELAGSVVGSAEAESLLGRVASEPLRAGELLSIARLGGMPAVPPAGGIMAVAVKPETAVGGKIAIGDRVRVIVSLAGPSGEARSETILPEAVVHDIGRSAQLSLSSSGTGERAPAPIATVSLIVRTPAEMERLAAAKAKGTIDLVLLPPRGADAPLAASIPPASDPRRGEIAQSGATPTGGR